MLQCTKDTDISILPWASTDGADHSSTRRMENIMTTEINLDTTTAALAEAFKSVQKLEVPPAARDFVKRTVSAARDRASEFKAGSESTTAALETAATDGIREAAKVARDIQQAIVDDTLALLNGFDQLASAQTLSEAVEINTGLLRSQAELLLSRTKSTTEYLGRLVSDGAKTAQDQFSKIVPAGKAA